MNWLIQKSNLSGIIKIPASKSLTIRSIIAASLADGTSTIHNYLVSDDTIAVINALRLAGIEIIEDGDKLVIKGNTFTNNLDTFNLWSSATAFRMLIFVFIVKFKNFKITANHDLLVRPFETFDKFFKKYNINYKLVDDVYHINGELTSGQYEIDGHISSQFASGLVLALSTLEGNSTILIENQLVSRPYLLMTISIIKLFSNDKIKMRGNLINIASDLVYHSHNYVVEGDYSQAAFYLVLAALGEDIKIKGLAQESLQGDLAIIHFLNQFGVTTKWENGLLMVDSVNLVPAKIDLIDNPDLFLIIGILASFINGETHMINIQNLRVKESDRVRSLTENFDILGVEYIVTHNTITIFGNHKINKEVKILNGYNDHRVIMSLVVYAVASKCPYLIKNVAMITKSYPNFLKDITNLGGKIEMKNIEKLREDIIDIDKKMIELFKRRSESVLLISNFKKELNLPIVDKDYEAKQLKIHLDLLGDKSIENQYLEFYSKILDISYQLQKGAPKMALIGKGLSHSLSPKLHHIIGRLNDFKYDYSTIEVEDEKALVETLDLIRKREYTAFNITMPYKEAVIKYLDVLTNKAHFSGVVNLVYMKNGQLVGDNADFDGIVYSIKQMDVNIQKHPIIILGTGATAKTMASVLDGMMLDYTFVSRDPLKNKHLENVISYEDLKKWNKYILINTTPVGMYPKGDEMPVDLEDVERAVYVFDVIYNPNPTKLVKFAKAGMTGLDMLVSQGLTAFNLVFDKKVVISKTLVEQIKRELDE
ncbi:MAG: 3-phosphoshikimate 1-carboxyvinyltransferase [Acholeplasmataceae bacterium]|jgi:3-phosphoshikimate 1-carboxyvinyltransferase